MKLSDTTKLLIALFIWIVLILSIADYGHAADIYIRDGGTGDGSAWNNALDDVPNDGTWDRPTRGNTYWFADGTYTGLKLAESKTGGSLPDSLVFRKATIANHGTETGWDNAYGDGQAIFGRVIMLDTMVFTGVQRTTQQSGHGFKVNISTDVNTEGIQSPNAPDNTHISYVEVEMYGITATQDNEGINVPSGGDNTYIGYCYIHEFSRTGFLCNVGENHISEYNYIYHAGGGVGHSDGIKYTIGANANLIIRWNYVVDCEGTGAIVIEDGINSSYAYIYGNIIWNSSDTWGYSNAAITNSGGDFGQKHMYVYNNTFYNLFARSEIGIRWSNSDADSNWAYNNVWHGSSKIPNFIGVTHDYNASDFDISESNNVILVSGPFVDPDNGDFTLLADAQITDEADTSKTAGGPPTSPVPGFNADPDGTYNNEIGAFAESGGVSNQSWLVTSEKTWAEIAAGDPIDGDEVVAEIDSTHNVAIVIADNSLAIDASGSEDDFAVINDSLVVASGDFVAGGAGTVADTVVVATADDDGFADDGGTWASVNSGTRTIVGDGAGIGYGCYIRGTSIIPQGTDPDSAFLYFRQQRDWAQGPTGTIRTEDTGNSTAITGDASWATAYGAVGDTTLAWDLSGIGALNAEQIYKSADCVDVVREAVLNSDWSSGNYITMFYEDLAAASGSNDLANPIAYESSADSTMYLVIYYEGSGGDNLSVVLSESVDPTTAIVIKSGGDTLTVTDTYSASLPSGTVFISNAGDSLYCHDDDDGDMTIKHGRVGFSTNGQTGTTIERFIFTDWSVTFNAPEAITMSNIVVDDNDSLMTALSTSATVITEGTFLDQHIDFVTVINGLFVRCTFGDSAFITQSAYYDGDGPADATNDTLGADPEVDPITYVPAALTTIAPNGTQYGAKSYAFLELTNPTGGETLIVGATEIIRWIMVGEDSVVVSFKIDDEAYAIQDTVLVDFLDWPVPNVITLTGKLLIEGLTAGLADSSGVFEISPPPGNNKTGWGSPQKPWGGKSWNKWSN